MIGAFVGASFGIGARVWANALGKQHTLARPWNHVACAIVGGYIGYNYMTWEDEFMVAVNEKRKQKGMVEINRDTVVPSFSKIVV